MPRPCCRCFRLVILVLAVLWSADQAGASAESAPAPFRVAWFRADVSPPLGQPVDIGFRGPTKRIEHPALAKGILLDDGQTRYVLCALDYSGVCNESYDRLRQAIAEAAGTDPSHVAVQALHQHTTVCLDRDAARILYRDDPDRLRTILEFEDEIADRITGAVTACCENLRPVTHVGTSQSKVQRVASSRRLRQPDGHIIARMSSTTDPALQALPEGLIDPWLKTITLYAQHEALVQLHYYATHPQSFYGDDRCTWDVPGIARERLQKESGVFQVYFTGCGGNVAMGKYNDGTPEARTQLAQRLYEGMQRSVNRIERHPAARLAWRTRSFEFPLREDAEFSAEQCRRIVNDAEQRFSARLKAAMCLAWIERVRAGRPVELSCLAIGPVRILHLPGEPFVEYQLAAQQFQPEQFVAVAGYGDCATWYIGPDQMYRDEGGYEQSWAFSGPCEQPLLEAIDAVLEN